MIALLLLTGVGVFVWTRRESAQSRLVGNERALAYEELIEIILVALHTGLSVADALTVAARCSSGPTSHDLTALTSRLDKGEPLRDVLAGLADVYGTRAYPLVDILRSSLTDGMPVLHVVERLADEARAERRRQLQEDLRRLPIRLVFPLVFCVLPSFVLLTIVPVGIHALSTFTHGGTP